MSPNGTAFRFARSTKPTNNRNSHDYPLKNGQSPLLRAVDRFFAIPIGDFYELHFRMFRENNWKIVWLTGKFLCFHFNKNNENTFTDFLFSRQSVGVDCVCPQTSLRHLPSTSTDAFHALKSVKAKTKNNGAGFVLGLNKSTSTMSISLSTMMFRWNVRLLSVSALISVNVIIWTREQGICICSVVAAFFCFCLEVLPAEGYSAAFGQGLLCPSIDRT